MGESKGKHWRMRGEMCLYLGHRTKGSNPLVVVGEAADDYGERHRVFAVLHVLHQRELAAAKHWWQPHSPTLNHSRYYWPPCHQHHLVNLIGLCVTNHAGKACVL